MTITITRLSRESLNPLRSAGQVVEVRHVSKHEKTVETEQE